MSMQISEYESGQVIYYNGVDTGSSVDTTIVTGTITITGTPWVNDFGNNWWNNYQYHTYTPSYIYYKFCRCGALFTHNIYPYPHLCTTCSNKEYERMTDLLNKYMNDFTPSPMQLPDGAKLIEEEKEMSTYQKLKDLTKGADQKLLEKYDILDSEGDLTEEGYRVTLAKLFENVKNDIVADLKKVDEADKKSKKNK